MDRRFSMALGTALILVGLVALVGTLIFPLVGWRIWRWWGPWRLWPLLVIGVGLMFVAPPLVTRGKPGLGGLFFPGIPTLVTGAILLFTSVFDVWGAWGWLWPLTVLSVALAFLLAAIYMRQIWLLFPAIIIGANGLLFQFCALTGWWEVWAVLWTIEPLSVGLAFLTLALGTRSRALVIPGAILCAIAVLGFMGMAALVPLPRFLPFWWLVNVSGPVVIILAGIALMLWGGRRRRYDREYRREG